MEHAKHLDLAIKTLCATILLGLLGNLLLGQSTWGIGFSLYAFGLTAAGAYLYRHRTLPIDRGVLGLVPPFLLFASLFAWRDAEALRFLNGLAVFALLGAFALRSRYGGLSYGSIVDYPFRLFERWLMFIVDALELAGLERKWPSIGKSGIGSRGMSVLRGLAIAGPLVFVFGALLVSADESFRQIVFRTFFFDLESLLQNGITTLACAWLVGGFLRRVLLAPEAAPMQGPPKPGTLLGPTEVNIVLGSLNLLFLAFVSLQFRYLFGGVEGSDLNYAEHARKGFFELVTVVGLALPVLLGIHSRLKVHSYVFEALAGTMVALLFVIMASATDRMTSYVGAYGISQLRIYVFAIMAWLGLSLLWFCATAMRRRPERFAFGSLVLGLAVIFALNIANPDGIVARVNTSREGNDLDVAYLRQLSTDAVPELEASLPKLTPNQRKEIDDLLHEERQRINGQSWRSWNLSRATAVGDSGPSG